MGNAATAPLGDGIPVIQMPNTGGKDGTPHLRHKSAADKLTDNLNGCRTLYENFWLAVEKHPGNKALGFRPKTGDKTYGPYEFLTYGECGKRAEQIAAGMAAKDIKKGDYVGLISPNRVEWVLVEQACNRQSIITVPLYDTFGVDAVVFIVNQTDLRLAVAARAQGLTLIEASPQCPSLKYIVTFEPLSAEEKAKCAAWVTCLSLAELEELGKKAPVAACPPAPSDLATLCYTSGTTGNPKGAMVTHQNFLASVSGATKFIDVSADDTHISYLPLAHLFERIVQVSVFHYAASMGFYHGNTMEILDDIKALRPTIFVSVPRLYNRIYEKTLARINSSPPWTKMAYQYGFAVKEANLKNRVFTHPFWDRLVFDNMKEALGGRARMMVTGAAPMAPEVKVFLEVCFSCRVVEGYGLTETATCGTVADDTMPVAGHVGIPSPSCEIKLADIPEMGYTANDKPLPRGEICIRGGAIFKGYFKNEQATAECIDPDGWFHTGDVGRLNENMTISIIDRKKNIFKLAQGEYVAPEKIEMICAKCTYVAQIFVHGSSLKTTIVAIVIPDEAQALQWGKANNLHQHTFEALCREDAFRAFILQELIKTCRDAKLKGFEIPKAVTLDYKQFSMENGYMTPTFKIKRQQVAIGYKNAIDAMYSNLD